MSDLRTEPYTFLHTTQFLWEDYRAYSHLAGRSCRDIRENAFDASSPVFSVGGLSPPDLSSCSVALAAATRETTASAGLDACGCTDVASVVSTNLKPVA